MKFYGYYLFFLISCGCSYLERWVNYGAYDLLWFCFMLSAIFFIAICKHQMILDREEAGKKRKSKDKNNNDNPF